MYKHISNKVLDICYMRGVCLLYGCLLSSSIYMYLYILILTYIHLYLYLPLYQLKSPHYENI